MNMLPYLPVIFFILFYLMFVWKILSKKWLTLSLLFLLITPWFNQLLFGGNFGRLRLLNFRPADFLTNALNNTSMDYLFFQGNIQEAGLFYVFQLPLIIFGFYFLLLKKNEYGHLLLMLFFLGLICAGLFQKTPNYHAGLLYVLPLEIISFTGLVYFLKLWRRSRIFIKLILTLFLLFAFYESLFYFHILLVHYPAKLLTI